MVNQPVFIGTIQEYSEDPNVVNQPAIIVTIQEYSGDPKVVNQPEIIELFKIGELL